MSFDRELEAFEAYAHVQPNNSVLLVDTYNTLEGVRHAAKVGQQLKAAGHKLGGIRLDSGDLAYLSIEARKILDAAGLQDASILASNDLDEHIITSLKQQGAAINVWGVGTKLVTGYDQPALGGIYKLGAIRHSGGEWEYKLKMSEQITKASTPGILQVRRYTRQGTPVADAIFSEPIGNQDKLIQDPYDPLRRRQIEPDAVGEDLLAPIFRGGKVLYQQPTLSDIRQRALDQVKQLHPTVRRFVNPHEYPVGLEPRLAELRTQLLAR
jgi:nicotinate phosphoribosyltransferase